MLRKIYDLILAIQDYQHSYLYRFNMKKKRIPYSRTSVSSTTLSKLEEYEEVIRRAKTPYAGMLLGDQYVITANMKWVNEIQEIIDHFHRRGLKVVSEHSECKYETMKFATQQKLIQNHGLLEELISCEGNIVYYSRYSWYWLAARYPLYSS